MMYCFKLTSHSCFSVTDKYLKLWKKLNAIRNGAGEKNKSQRNPLSVQLRLKHCNNNMIPSAPVIISWRLFMLWCSLLALQWRCLVLNVAVCWSKHTAAGFARNHWRRCAGSVRLLFGNSVVSVYFLMLPLADRPSLSDMWTESWISFGA